MNICLRYLQAHFSVRNFWQQRPWSSQPTSPSELRLDWFQMGAFPCVCPVQRVKKQHILPLRIIWGYLVGNIFFLGKKCGCEFGTKRHIEHTRVHSCALPGQLWTLKEVAWAPCPVPQQSTSLAPMALLAHAKDTVGDFSSCSSS